MWQVSSPYCAETVESSDAYLVAGPTFNDYTTTGWTLLLTPQKACTHLEGARNNEQALLACYPTEALLAVWLCCIATTHLLLISTL